MKSRREFVLGALAAPAVLKSAAKRGYSWAEIEKIMNTDIDKYYADGLDKEYSQILERDAKRKK